MAKSELTGNAKTAVECLQQLKRKTKDPVERKKIDNRIKDIKECYK